MAKEKPMAATLTLVMVTDQNGDGKPNHGDTINFTIAPAGTEWSQPDIVFYQPAGASSKDRKAVASSIQTPTYQHSVTLNSGIWQSGAADGVARLLADRGNKFDVIAELAFPVSA